MTTTLTATKPREPRVKASHLSIADVEEMVGRKAANVEVREREILIYFGGVGGPSGCHLGPHEGSSGGDLIWHLKRW